MEHIVTLNHTKWDCKYHVVFIPKYRRKALYAELRKELGQIFRSLAGQKECIIEGRRSFASRSRSYDNVNTAEVAVSQVIGFIKGKSAIHIARLSLEESRILQVSISG